MVRLEILILTLILNNLIVYLDAEKCPKGQRVSRKTGYCEDCPDRYYQPAEAHSKQCNSCTICDESSGSGIKQSCTKVSNTVCECQPNFIAMEADSSTCKCPVGFGLHPGKCSPCLQGQYSAKVDSPCRKWKECNSGVKTSGTAISDVICSDNEPAMSPTTDEQIARVTPSTTLDIITFTSSAPTRVTLKGNKGVETHIGVIIVITGLIVCLLLFAVVWKLRRNCTRKVVTLQVEESLCRQPVEESGDDSSSSQKNPEEI